jgi:hypothetical protein
LFVRAGSILPMAPAMDSSDQKPVDPLTLDIYPGPLAAEFTLYEDDGTSLDYRAGAHARTPLRFIPDAAGNYTLRIGSAQGKFNGQLAKRCYRVQLHGLCKPDRVALHGRKLPEVAPGREGDGWWWNQRERTITVRLDRPVSTSKEAVLSLSNAGTFADLATWQKAWNLRAQVRQAKRDMKLKHATLVGGPGIKKPPRVIRETEQVEQLLTAIIDNPKGSGRTPPDYAALEQRVRAALTNDPFQSNRNLPEFDPESRQGMELTKGAKFTAEEIQTITNRLRGPSLPAWLWGGN